MCRKLLILCLLAALPLGTSWAQLRFGPKAGAQLSRVAFDDKSLNQQYTSYLEPGWLGGLMLNYKVSPLLSLQTEFFYSRNRRHIEGADNRGVGVTNKSTYHYLNLPVLLRFSGHTQYKKSKVEYYVNFGPNIMRWLGGRGELHHPDMEEALGYSPMNYTILFADTLTEIGQHMLVRQPNRFQMAFDVGGGLVFDLGFGHGIMVDFRGSFGLGKSFFAREDGYFNLQNPDEPPTFYTDPMAAVNHSYALSVGYVRDFNFYAWLRKGKRAKTSH